jgi:hypothetical protein
LQTIPTAALPSVISTTDGAFRPAQTPTLPESSHSGNLQNKMENDIQPVKDRSHWKIRKFDSFEEQRTQQVRDWQALSGADRRKAAWELVYDYWVGMKGMHPDELRLQRSVTKLTRM